MSDLEERIDDMENTVEVIDYTVDTIQTKTNFKIGKLVEDVNNLKKILALATSPDEKDQEKFKMLREAYEKYEFTKKLVLGTEDD